jgi:hypothetical protein
MFECVCGCQGEVVCGHGDAGSCSFVCVGVCVGIWVDGIHMCVKCVCEKCKV